MSVVSTDSSAILTSVHSTSKSNSRILYQAPLSMAYEKTIMKEKCGLCAMYFHRNSVNYKVPNHRIYELEKSWDIKRSGRRYQNAAFLYKMIDVCCFCSQFFKLLPDELLKSQELNQISSSNNTEKPLKLEITTKLERTNIAIEQRTYQSSVIDNHIAGNATKYPTNNHPYEIIAKTKREVDPWWEIDFSQKFHIHSLSFLISTSKRQKLVFSIFLLNRPYGFEDPFYDSIKSKAIITKEITLPEKDQPGMNPIEWEFVDITYCTAIRIQIKGIHLLGIQQFKTYRGDILVPLSPRDLENTMNSFATLSPAAIKLGRYEMMSADKKKELTNNENSMILTSKPKVTIDVNHLAMTIYKKNLKLDQWKETVLQATMIFSQEEIEALYKVIFKYASDLCTRNINVPAIKENELQTSALLQHYPRCELSELHQRVRSVVRWIQTRSHLKNLGVLANSKNFELAANDPSLHLYNLQSAFKRIEYYWNKKEIREQSMISTSKDKLKFKGTRVSELRGCSWSQFLVTISLFCTQETIKIPSKAFFVKEIRAAYGSNAIFNNAIIDNLSPTSNHTVNSKGEDDNISYGSGNGKSVSTYSLITLTNDENDLQITDKQIWLNELSSPKIFNQDEMKKELESNKTFLEKARQKELFPYYNSSFSEYKFAKFQRKIKFKEIIFPKYLDLNFAKSLFPRRGESMESIYEEQYESCYDNNNINNELENPVIAAPSLEEDLSGLDELDKDPYLMNGDVINIPRARINTTIQSRKSRIASMMPKMNSSSSPGRNRFASIMTTTTTTTNNNKVRTNLNGVNNNETNNPPFVVNQGKLSIITPLIRPIAMQAISNINNDMNNNMKNRNTMLTMNNNNMNMKGKPYTAITNTLQRPKTTQSFDIPTNKHHIANHNHDNDSDSQSIGSMNYSDIGSKDFNSERGKHRNKASAVLDFFRVCTLCEKKFPRDAIDKKVIRKHVIDLRNSWDPDLVPKETKLLSNSITMYNLVYVCLFCYQFFDPDYADGIAHPVRIDSPSLLQKKGVLGAIESQSDSSPYKLFYDSRYETNPIEVGEIFQRPLTVESRIRALKAIEISKSFDSKRL